MEAKKERLIFIDLMRAFAVLQMVQGHTINSLLSPEYRTIESGFYYIWHTIRGFTAPIFMFTSGLAFTYLLRSVNIPFNQNPRVVKGLKRVGLLLFLGYILRFPLGQIFDLSGISYAQWLTFYTVDALHIIGMGLLFVIGLSYISEKFKISDNVSFTVAALFFFLLAPSVLTSNTFDTLPPILRGFFTDRYGSLFPLFPWAGYVMAGAILGSFIANNKEFVKTRVFSYNLVFYGSLFVSLSAIISQLSIHGLIEDKYWVEIIKLVLLRTGVVIALYGFATIIEKKMSHCPKIVRMLGGNTLFIYVAHLMVLYGFVFFPGFDSIAGSQLNSTAALSSAVAMILLMIGMVKANSKLKYVFKR